MLFEEERRRQLGAFLARCRARLRPAEVGLPDTARRRVPGLRREEVAELLGVSADWYRWFESGRPIHVSQRFLTGLSAALRLDAHDEVTLYRLALPGLYEAHSKAEAIDASPRLRLLCAPIGSPSEIEPAARMLVAAREKFLTSGNLEPVQARPRIVRSWLRSVSTGVDADRRIAPLAITGNDQLDELRTMNERLLRAAQPVVSHLADSLSETGYVVVLTDAKGCILDLVGDASVRSRLSKIAFEPGADWSEAASGTNTIGTVLMDGRPLQLMAAEHFCEGWHALTCTAAPIRDPVTLEVIGVLDVTGDYHLVRPHVLALLIQCATEIEELLAIAR